MKLSYRTTYFANKIFIVGSSIHRRVVCPAFAQRNFSTKGHLNMFEAV